MFNTSSSLQRNVAFNLKCGKVAIDVNNQATDNIERLPRNEMAGAGLLLG